MDSDGATLPNLTMSYQASISFKVNSEVIFLTNNFFFFSFKIWCKSPKLEI